MLLGRTTGIVAVKGIARKYGLGRGPFGSGRSCRPALGFEAPGSDQADWPASMGFSPQRKNKDDQGPQRSGERKERAVRTQSFVPLDGPSRFCVESTRRMRAPGGSDWRPSTGYRPRIPDDPSSRSDPERFRSDRAPPPGPCAARADGSKPSPGWSTTGARAGRGPDGERRDAAASRRPTRSTTRQAVPHTFDWCASTVRRRCDGLTRRTRAAQSTPRLEIARRIDPP